MNPPRLPQSFSPNDTASVTVIIINWNCKDVLGKCLNHLSNQSLPPNRILVIDNASSDDSLCAVTGNDQIHILRLDKNLGFAGGNNYAISKCDTHYIALLNPDAYPAPDWLEQLMRAADAHPEVSAFSSLQLCDGNPDFVDGAGDSYHVSGLVWRDRHQVAISASDHHDRPVFSPCAAAAMYRRQALLEVSGFDDDFFCYVEDVDLGFRLRLAGHQAMLAGKAVVRHVGSVSTGGQRSDFCVYHGHRNLIWAYIKNMPGFLFWLFLPLHLLLNVFSVVYFTAKGQGRVILRAKIDAMKGIMSMWQKRKIIQNKRVASVFEILQILDKRFLFIHHKSN